ncbi:nickel-responsive transcriptional regulator NikR [Desulfovibrio litoralis]|uniref:Putative nickel-responsive regulator n=1 Tax=Desulfovibrio litoralis DSM 11393 TaxID=1121455 RepID=A0A1M7TQ94_9BACT|nr:nickel-responsive transcriptional regulator NikR [Desulfovibrio litoralis]SHN72909.1 transcriptional regulator, CopG family [Desulfovibrio litoralis DSM 11393]
MSKLTRFGVSLDSDLLEQFDMLCSECNYPNRSEALRDLIRKALVERNFEDDTQIVAGTLTFVYDHHKSDLAQHLTAIQHDMHDLVLSSLHLHLDHHNCLEVIVLKGKGKDIRQLGEQIISCKGVKHGRLVLTTTGEDF